MQVFGLIKGLIVIYQVLVAGSFNFEIRGIMAKNILILGGYGNAGKLVAELLLSHSDAHITIAGRNAQRAKDFAEELNATCGAVRAAGVAADAASYERLLAAFQGMDMVVVASSTSEYVANVAKAAIDCGSDYLDVQLSIEQKLAALRDLEPVIRDKNRLFITDGGFHPGVPAALVRFAGTHFDRLETAQVGSLIQIDWAKLSFAEATITEMVDELTHYRPVAFRQSAWKNLKYREFLKFVFPEPFGQKICAPMYLEEMQAIPDSFPHLTDTGFYVAGFNWFTDYFVMPFVLYSLKIFPRLLLKPASALFTWSLKAFSRPPFATILQLEATGVKNGRYSGLTIRLQHEDGYFLTAVPVVACLLQYLDDQLPRAGLYLQAHAVEPARFIQDMQRIGIGVSIDHDLQER
jgi:hypothetical protein